MPTYLYECPMHGEFEYEHSINDELELCPLCKDDQRNAGGRGDTEPQKVKRLIAKGSTFILAGGGWARDNYS